MYISDDSLFFILNSCFWEYAFVCQSYTIYWKGEKINLSRELNRLTFECRIHGHCVGDEYCIKSGILGWGQLCQSKVVWNETKSNVFHYFLQTDTVQMSAGPCQQGCGGLTGWVEEAVGDLLVRPVACAGLTVRWRDAGIRPHTVTESLWQSGHVNLSKNDTSSHERNRLEALWLVSISIYLYL